MLEKLIIQKTLRVPASTGEAGDGTPVARQLDAALLDVGFSASRALLEHVGGLATGPALDLAPVYGRMPSARGLGRLGCPRGGTTQGRP